jgi:hypothetical protein
LAKNKKAKRKGSKGKSVNQTRALREHLVYLLKGGGAHVHFEDALDGLPRQKRGAFVKGLPHTAWQLLEHARLAQWDILEFSRDAKHTSPEWPEGYWPRTPVPPNDAAWEKSAGEFKSGLREMIRLVENPRTDLCAKIPYGHGKTILREALLLADHNAYHLGQLVYLRRALHCWPEE